MDDNSAHLCLCLRLRKDEDALSISGVNEGDEGTYTCTVRSEIDQDSAWARLTVLGTLSWEQCVHASGWNNACLLKLSPSLNYRCTSLMPRSSSWLLFLPLSVADKSGTEIWFLLWADC